MPSSSPSPAEPVNVTPRRRRRNQEEPTPHPMVLRSRVRRALMFITGQGRGDAGAEPAHELEEQAPREVAIQEESLDGSGDIVHFDRTTATFVTEL